MVDPPDMKEQPFSRPCRFARVFARNAVLLGTAGFCCKHKGSRHACACREEFIGGLPSRH